ncbi:MAG: right-handed parallel beta-helix repeat-containing protein [Pseudotabrizicola sp.]|uniref:right-handed parallel beta-helix repeat-containing protein n=1 Tax=Pseudotabrizicola sp. TaxID=2939647 RepID=UPI00271F1F9E|nr:right-handed parallel beta-helix repeat-containing protein [Pseudotabrizicola sp.]MDO9640847.1 right-handed parallel beta-helix repeat-containing protein [Pseudotabrizicola sp.]
MLSAGRKFIGTLALLFGLGLLTVASAQTTVRLAPGDNLAEAITAARPGDVLELRGGDYGALTVRRAGGEPGLPVTVRSADPANPARFSELTLHEMTYLVLDGLVFDYRYSAGDKHNIRPFRLLSSRGLTIRNSLFDGDSAPDDSPGNAAYPTGFGIGVRSSADIRLEGNDIRDFYRGLVVHDTVGMAVVRNDIHSMRMDGMNFSQVEQVLIEENLVRDFTRALDSDDHADMIQFWTTKTERPNRDITIRNNVLNSGLGGYTQSIFMRNEEVDTGRAGAEMYYRNITIEGNVIINAHMHGITVGETDGLIIRNNSVLHNARSDGRRQNVSLWTPQVRVAGTSRNVRIENNVLHKISGHERQSDWTVRNNAEVQDRFANQPNHYNALFMAPINGDPRDIGSFRHLPGGALAGSGLGAALLDNASTAVLPELDLSGLGPAVRTLPDPDRPNRFTFDIAEGSAKTGLDLTGTRAVWDFGDGSHAEGITVSHTFDKPGLFNVALTLTLADGQVQTSSARVTPRRPEVIEYDPRAGTITSFVEENPSVLDIPVQAGSLKLGGGNALITVPRESLTPFFGARSFSLQTRLRTDGGYKAAGVVLHLHKTLIVTISGRGTVDVEFTTETARLLKVSTPPIPILTGDWVDLTIDYSDADQMLRVLVDGKVAAQGRSSGQIRPLEYWGLSLGFAFENRNSFQGEMAHLVLKVGKDGTSTGN